MSAPPAVEMIGISKSFGPVKALVDASLRIRRGTIHGLVGQNGAGKSTIIKVLAGFFAPDAGEIAINGRTETRLSPAYVEELGVHFIHQERLLVPTATVAEAIFLNQEPAVGPFLRSRLMKARARELVRQYFDIDLSPDTLVRDLTTAQQKIVQIMRALVRDASVLVLDEPTAALIKREVDSLFKVLSRLRDEGLAIIFISHYMQEIEALCDEVTVMRNGATVGVVDPRTVPMSEIVTMMINRDVGEMYPRRQHALSGPLLRVENLSKAGSFENISFEVRAGEIVGLTGLLGSGVKPLVECLFGLDRPDSGRILIEGEARKLPSPSTAVRNRIAMVPEDRRAHGVAVDLSVRDNISLASLERVTTHGFIAGGREAAMVDKLIRDLSITTPDRTQLVRNLSGGNQQKVTLAKWLGCQSRIYILDEPTVAVDVGAKVEIYGLLNRLVADGAAVLFLSSDLLELAGFCDRVIVVYRGGLNGEFSGAAMNSDALLAAASGAVSVATEGVAS